MRWARPRFSRGESPGSGAEARRPRKQAGATLPGRSSGELPAEGPRGEVCTSCDLRASAPSSHTRAGNPATRPGRRPGRACQAPGARLPMADPRAQEWTSCWFRIPEPGRSSTTADGAPERPAYGNREGGVRHQAAPLGRPPARARYGGRARVDGWSARVHYGGCTAGRTGNRHAPPLRESRFPGQPWRYPPATADGALPPPPPSRIPGQRGRVVGTDLLPRQGGVWTRGSGPEGVAVATPLLARAVAAPVMPTGRQGLRHRTAGGVAPDRPGPGPLILRGPGNVYDE